MKAKNELVVVFVQTLGKCFGAKRYRYVNKRFCFPVGHNSCGA